MRKLVRNTTIATTAVLVATLAPAAAGGGHHHHHHQSRLSTVVDGLDGPRGVDALGRGKTLVTETDGSFSLVVERRHRDPRVTELGSVPGGFPPAIAAGRRGRIYLLTGASGEPGSPQAPGAATLYEWRHGYDAPKPVFDVAAYQVGDPDPDDLENLPADSNPFGLAALRDGSVLIADAAGNDLLRWWPDGTVKTVARLKPRVVDVPDGVPLPEEQVPSEGVATSVTVGPDGYWYVGELRGFPATPGTSQIWRIKPGSVDAVCDPEDPRHGRCTRYADGLTSIVDLGADHRSVYAVSLSKLSWLAVESEEPVPGAEIGALYRLIRGHHQVRVKELASDRLTLPAGVDVDRRGIYVTGPVFGPGALSKIR
ncbi:ScyD/ScyE family protein [Nocardioides sp. cx-173]|uniref:ScyD/ScyE family protein n=1 Tax=Nocardioides sp. cx-173 TaxID=2898796 RepID=UPI001E56F086|nr:ScyD/ScyE family protein [Nocardioides sp. cx-173]MCD4526696.1 ScyD/ScyE family protein [Nocardioides sp. cx-173]UGB42562.1 ScyD/ScyE family protein [Nocardioides sp. cx-173]